MARWIHIEASECTPETFIHTFPSFGNFPDQDATIDFSAEIGSSLIYALGCNIVTCNGTIDAWYFEGQLYVDTTMTVAQLGIGQYSFTDVFGNVLVVTFDLAAKTIQFAGQSPPFFYSTATASGFTYCEPPTPPYPPYVP
jgi:hypothetical protein